jgi:hypothetical protein
VARLVLITLCIAACSAAGEDALQSLWYRVEGGPNTDEAWAVATDSAGNAYWASHQTVPGPLADVYLSKIAPDGTPLWATAWARSENQQAYIVTVKEPYVYVGGTIWKGLWLNSVDMALACFNTSDGALQWEFTWDQGFGYEEIDGLVVTDEAIYVTGWTTGASTSGDLAVLRLTLDGQLDWSTTWGTPQWDEANGQIAVIGGTVYVAGRYDAPSELFGGDAVLAAFAAVTGQYEWHKTWGGSAVDDALGLIGGDGTLAVVGFTTSYGGSRIFLLSYDLAGTLQWEALWGGTGSEAARAVSFLPGGDILVGGKTTAYGGGEFDALLLRYSPDGLLRWHSEWGGAATDEIHGIAVADSSLYIAGETWSWGAGRNDALLVKATVDGEFPAWTPDLPDAGPADLRLWCHPNPCRSTTTVCFDLPVAGPATLHLLDLAGRMVAERANGPAGPGVNTLRWELPMLPPGAYLCRVEQPGVMAQAPLIVVP